QLRPGLTGQVLPILSVRGPAPDNRRPHVPCVRGLPRGDAGGQLDPGAVENFLRVITAFIWAYSITRPGVNALRTPVFPEMIRITKDGPVNFENHRFEADAIVAQYRNYQFTNGRQISKSMLVWWAFQRLEERRVGIGGGLLM